MESRHLLIEGGLIIKHSGELTGLGLINYLCELFKARAFDQAKYVVSDFSVITCLVFEESYGHEIGTIVHEFRSIRITLRRPIRWAVVTDDPSIEQLAGVIAVGAGTDIYLRVFANIYEAVLWGKHRKAFTEIENFMACKYDLN